MDSDDLYDSLDEDTEQQSETSPAAHPEVHAENVESRVSTKNAERREASTDYLHKDDLLCDIASVIPLYDGETLRDRVKKFDKGPSKKSKGKDPTNTKKSSGKFRVPNKPGLWCGDGFKVPLEFREQNTYSNIFHARSGRLNPNRKDPTDTSRAHCGDETHRTDVSDVSTHFSDAKSTISDTTSFYFDLLKKTEASPNLTESKSTPLKKVYLESSHGSDFDLKSASQFSINASTITSTSANSRKSRSQMSVVTPILGSLGPDMEAVQDKLSALKKRRSYGQKVSDRNLIKMQEMKVLRDLKYEMKKSRL